MKHTTAGKTKKSGVAYRAHWSRKPTEKDVKAFENMIEAAKDQQLRLQRLSHRIVLQAHILVEKLSHTHIQLEELDRLKETIAEYQKVVKE